MSGDRKGLNRFLFTLYFITIIALNTGCREESPKGKPQAFDPAFDALAVRPLPVVDPALAKQTDLLRPDAQMDNNQTLTENNDESSTTTTPAGQDDPSLDLQSSPPTGRPAPAPETPPDQDAPSTTALEDPNS